MLVNNAEIQDVALECANGVGEIQVHAIRLSAIQTMITRLMHDMDDLEGQVSPQVQYFINNYATTLRVIDLAFESVMQKYHMSVQKLLEDSEQLVERLEEESLNGLDEDTKAFYEAKGRLPQHTFELHHWKNGGRINWMTPERDREIAIGLARKAFVEEFNAEPTNDDEALNWHQEQISKMIIEIETSEKADAPTSTKEK